MRRERGLTLVELVVSMAIFALVATLGLQALTGTLRVRDRVADDVEAVAALGFATSLLRRDLSALVPLLDAPRSDAPGSAIAAPRPGRELALSLGGQPRIGTGGGFARATWQVAPDGTLRRAFRPTLAPLDPVPGTWMPLLDGVRSLSVRSHWPDAGWVAGTAPPVPPGSRPEPVDSDAGPAPPELYSSTLPEAVEVTLDTEDFGRIVLVESLK